jgi:hypothetical protein
MAQRTANFMAAGKHTRHVRANLGVLTIGAGLLILALPWAWHNYHAGLGDRRGALRLATVFLLLRLLVWLLMLRAAPAKAVIYAFVVELVLALGVATIAWLYYIALEPYARRHWPHMLITWSRVLRLRLGDPSVGQHVLIGVGLGLLWTMVVPMERLLVEIMNWPCRPIVVYDVTLQNLLGGRLAIAGGLSGIEGSLIRALLFVLLLSALRSILRVQSLAAVLTSLLLGLTLLTRAANLWTGIVFFVLIGAGFGVWMTMRYGLVMLFIAIFINRTLNTLPLSLADRFDDLSYLALAVVLGLALYGYMIGRRETSSEASRSVIGAAPPAPS